MVEKKETKKTAKKVENKNSEKVNLFWEVAQEKIFEFGTLALKKGITNMAISKIDDTEEKIKKAVDEKIKKHIGGVIKIISFLIAGSFLFYGIVELILEKFDLAIYTNVIFGGIFLLIALFVNNKK